MFPPPVHADADQSPYSRRIRMMYMTATTEDSKLFVFKYFAFSLEEMKNAAIILWS